ncbi:MAG: hypothetical protein LBM12_01370 [Candidatus Nomurabacteria bacterium]|jgi:hypothetical protein|nr:hypothetical protein [Candidatus Nomurabacteria bacterium]
MQKQVELNGVKMQSHERDSILRLRKLGFDARPIKPSGVMGTPDVMIGNQLWEIKTPDGGSRKSTIENQFSRAKKQSIYLVIDCVRLKLPDDFAVRETARQLRFPVIKHSIKQVKIITKALEVIDITKKA